MSEPGDSSQLQDQRDSRREYDAENLTRSELPMNPWDQFSAWLARAMETDAIDATAMALATVSESHVPSVRIVLLKHWSESGLCWYTDYRSRKGSDLLSNPLASVVFYWRELSRQVRITGVVTRLDTQTSQSYFDSRPLDSRLSAAASKQSAVIADRRELEDAVTAIARNHPQDDVPMPEDWGGYCLRPDAFEFWQGRVGRLHDRFRYMRSDAEWLIERLQP